MDDKTIRERLLPLQLDGFDDISAPQRARGTRCASHYYIAKTGKNTKLYVTKDDAGLFDGMGDTVRLAYSTNSGALAILPESYGVGSPRKVSTNCGALSVTLSQFHAPMFERFGARIVGIAFEAAEFGGARAVVARPVEV